MLRPRVGGVNLGNVGQMGGVHATLWRVVAYASARIAQSMSAFIMRPISVEISVLTIRSGAYKLCMSSTPISP